MKVKHFNAWAYEGGAYNVPNMFEKFCSNVYEINFFLTYIITYFCYSEETSI